MRILFIHEVNYLEKPIFEMHEFPEYLSSIGHDVGFLHYAEGWSLSKAQAQGVESTIAGRVLPGTKLKLFTPQQSSKSIGDRLIMALRAGRVVRETIKAFKPDLIVSFAVPTSGWQALKESNSLGIPFVFRALDVSHRIRVSPFTVLIKFAERFIYKRSTLVSANNPAMLEYCVSMGANPAKSVVDFPPLDSSHFALPTAAKFAARAKLGISEDMQVILYMGSFFYFSGLPEVIQRFASLSPINTLLVLVGGGEQDAELRALADRLGIRNQVLFTGFVNFSELPSYLSTADVAINPLVSSLVSNAAFPNKVLQYMASGLPVVSTRLAGLESALGNSAGLFFAENPGEVLDIALSIGRSENLSELGEDNRLQVVKLFDIHTTIRSFALRLQALLDFRGKTK